MTEPKATRREWIGLAVIALPCLIYSMDLTVLNLAVPQITAELAPSASQLLWIVDIYGFLVAGALITMGTLGDRIGRRRLLLIGAAAFGAASIFAAYASTAAMLILARALMGIAAATLAPSTLSLIRNMFLDPGERMFAIGVWIASFSAGGAIGPLIGGVLLEHFHWGSVFLLNIPIMALLLLLGPVLLPEFRDENAGRLDLGSAALSIAAVLGVIYGVKHLAEHGLHAEPFVWIAGGLGIGLMFVRRQRRLADPLIDVRLFSTPALSAALAINVLGLFAIFGFFLIIAQYLQLVLGMGPLEAGLWTAPSGLAFVAGSLATPWLVRRVRPAYVITAGFVQAAVGFAVLTQIGGEQSLAVLMTGFLLLCLGLAPVGTVTTDLVMGVAPPERAGAASSISETSFELGGALGIAVLGSVFNAVYRTAMQSAALPAEQARLAAETLGGAARLAARLPDPAAAHLVATARDAFTGSMQFTSVICMVIMLAAALLASVALRDVRHAATNPDPRLEPADA